MRRVWAYALVLTGVCATGAVALERSPRPEPRPPMSASVADIPVRPPVFGPTATTPRPKARPTRAQPAVVQASAGGGISRSQHPRPRPPVPVVRTAAPVQSQPSAVLAAGKEGKVCGDKDIRGRKVAPIPGSIAGCGVSDPVQVTMVDGVALSRPSTMDCDTAKALKEWVEDGVKPSVKRLGGGVVSLQIAAHYSCRTRNNQPGAKISEHGKGKAVDISAINLKNGQTISVLKHWGRGAEGKILSQMHKAACGPFGTVLGPESDRYHKDHFHFDTARYRSGPYCR